MVEEPDELDDESVEVTVALLRGIFFMFADSLSSVGPRKVDFGCDPACWATPWVVLGTNIQFGRRIWWASRARTSPRIGMKLS